MNIDVLMETVEPDLKRDGVAGADLRVGGTKIGRDEPAADVMCGTNITPGSILDPLDLDYEDDVELVVSLKGLSRISFVAAQAGARFESEGIRFDSAAWMMTPRRLFGGLPAYRACLEREHFIRAVLLHGLALGLDADPGDIDVLTGHDDDEDEGERFGP